MNGSFALKTGLLPCLVTNARVAAAASVPVSVKLIILVQNNYLKLFVRWTNKTAFHTILLVYIESESSIIKITSVNINYL